MQPRSRTGAVLSRVRSRLASGTPNQPTSAGPTSPGTAQTADRGRATTPPAAPKSKPDLRFVRAFLRVGRAVLGGDAFSASPEQTPYDPEIAKVAIATARQQRGQSILADVLSRGGRLEAALVASVRDLTNVGDWTTARALVEAMRNIEGGERAHRLGQALSVRNREYDPLAWAALSALSDTDIAAHIPVEGVGICVRRGDDAALERARAIAAQLGLLSDPALVELAARFVAIAELPIAARLVEEVDRRGTEYLDDDHVRQLEAILPWLEPTTEAVPPTGAVPIGIIGYHQPDRQRASSDVGDYVQTLAMLGNLCRFSGVRFDGVDGLGELATEIQNRVRPELRLPEQSGHAYLMPVNRDFSRLDPIPERTWTIASGWHMHSLFEMRFDFPYHPNVRPLFISFHVNNIGMLTPDALDYLRTYGPVGCRDWTTVDLLLSAGVDAFFTGCLTTTIDGVFPATSEVEPEDQVVALIDVPPAAGANAGRRTEVVSHGDIAGRYARLVDGVHAAIELLDGYQHRYSHIITSRLHSYLPATSLGIDVTFTPKTPGDVRLDGLDGMQPDGPRLNAMRDGIRELVAEVLRLVLSGAGEDEVYARWHELTRRRVEEAKARFAEPPPELPLGFDPEAAVTTARRESRAYGDHDRVDPTTVTDVAVSLDQNLKAQLPVMLESLVDNATGPLRLWITCRGLDETYQQWISDAFPDVPMTFLPFDHVDYGEIGRMLSYITPSTMDRLLFPSLLHDLDRLVYLDIDIVVLGDVCVLARLDLADNPLAARSSISPAAHPWRFAGNQLSREAARELRHRMAARLPFEVRTMNAGILVLDLNRMRRDRFTEACLPWVSRYGLHDQDVLFAYAGSNRTELDPRWNRWPPREDIGEAWIVHYLTSMKPWATYLAPAREHWQTYEDASRRRIGDPPD
ncbi:MAG: hypothetical protein GEU93_19745 [Propionibacteriales bacterium]|nr:hypothetical protein [Propionibacteriales bacterium]